MWGWRSSRTVVVGLAAGAFVVLCLAPVAYMFGLALGATNVFDIIRVDLRQRALLLNTTLLGLGTAVSATLVGAPLGCALARIELPFKTGLRVALAAPSVLPPYVVALAWTYALAEYSLVGAIAVLTIVFYPLSMLATEVSFRRIEPRLEEAALLVASPNRVVRGISLPLALPGILSAGLIIFVLAVSEFSVPGLLRVRVFTTEVFTAFAALYDFSRATVLAIPLLTLSIVIAGASATLAGSRLLSTRRRLHGAVPASFDLWRWRAATMAVGVVIIAVVAPIGVLVREASRSTSIAAAVAGSQTAIITSLVLAVIGATAVTTLATFLGYARARSAPAMGAGLDVLWIALFTVPSTVVGIGLIGLWNRSGAPDIYGSATMLILGYLARLLPIAAHVLGATIGTVSLAHEEAAAIAGAGWTRTMLHIVVPQIRLGLVAVWMIAFVLAFGEVGTSILVAPPGETTLPIRVYTLIANAPPGHVATLALFQAFVIFCPLMMLGFITSVRDSR